ncbi:MAG TPA: (Fe-S)-binding protein [Cyanobacteria bacterium UBA8530]|nr:(Fe-S)-binding protein [Cyanobacteria bacterium UBA8530]
MAKILKAERMDQCIGCMFCMLACARTIYKTFSVERSALRIRTAGGFHSQFLADICLGCLEPACAAVCPTQALKARPGGGVKLDKEVCIRCMKCQDACPVKVVKFDAELSYPIVCAQCGACAKACPHSCLQFEERK